MTLLRIFFTSPIKKFRYVQTDFATFQHLHSQPNGDRSQRCVVIRLWAARPVWSAAAAAPRKSFTNEGESSDKDITSARVG